MLLPSASLQAGAAAAGQQQQKKKQAWHQQDLQVGCSLLNLLLCALQHNVPHMVCQHLHCVHVCMPAQVFNMAPGNRTTT
jgi:hypothetical protein